MSRPSEGSWGRRVVLLGGTSEIGLACVRELQDHAPRKVALVGRDLEGMRRAGESLLERGVGQVIFSELDALDLESHEEALRKALTELGGADIVILAVGVLGERGGMPADVAAGVEVLQTNVVGAGSLLLHAAGLLLDGGGGALVVLSSVAAERPRRANAIYGASKAGLDSLAQSLGDALQEQGVRVLVVRAGFVHSKMTRGLEAAPFASTPEQVAIAVREGLERGRETVWVPRRLRLVMGATRLLPRSIFRRIRQ